jgi:hypothetical protein
MAWKTRRSDPVSVPFDTFLAHAFGQRYESPVPLFLFVMGGAFVVLLSFALVVRRRVEGAGSGVTQEDPAVPRGNSIGSPVSVLVLLLLVLAGLFGTQTVDENIVPTVFWVYLWVVFPLVVGLLGDWTQAVNPFAAIARASGTARARKLVLGTETPMAWPAGLGYWLAVLFYFLLVEGELIFNTQAVLPRVTAVGLVLYAVICAVGGLVFGADAWNSRAEVFSVLFSTWGKLGWFRFGQPGRRGFAGGLQRGFESSPSRVTFLLLLLVSVTFDGLLSTPQWITFSESLPGSPAKGTGEYNLMASLVFVLLTCLMFVGFGVFAYRTSRAGEHGDALRSALTGLLPSLLPISYGYLLAHYSQYVLINGQLILPLLGNPTGTLADSVLPYPFNSDYIVNTGIMPTSVVWYVQIVVIVLAHVIAVVLAHRYLGLRARDHRLALRSEWPWLVAMVCYTMISLWLLAQPLIEVASDQSALAPPARVTAAAQPAG